MDLVVLSLAKKGAKQYTDTVINNLPKGVIYKGSVNYYKDLPNSAEIGDCYSVLYEGETGSKPSGIEYVWGLNTATSTEEWIAFGPDLSDYVKFTDYASDSTGGVIKIGNGSSLTSGNNLQAVVYDYSTYVSKGSNAFISKGTLENVLTGKELVSKSVNNLTNYTTTTDMNTLLGNKLDSNKVVNASSTTAGQTYDVRYINGLVGDIDSALDAINGEVIS